MKPTSFTTAAACALAVVASAASAQSASPHAAHATTTSQITPLFALQPQPAPFRADTTITIRTVGADLEFLPSEIALRQGTRVTIRYVNQGTFPHNFVLVKNDDDIDVLGVAAFQAGSTGYVPLAEKDRMLAYSPLAAPGETVEFGFVVPPAGEYPFACLYPGHYNMMVGTLRALK